MAGPTWEMFADSSVTFNMGNDDVTVVGSDLTSPAYDFLNGLSDLGITWSIGDNGVVNITGNANPKEMIPVAKETKEVPIVTPNYSSSGLIGAIKEQNNNTSSFLNQQNVILDNHSKLLKESNDINRVLAEQMIRANDISAMTATTIATSFDRLIELKKVTNASNIYNSYVQEDMVNVLNKSGLANSSLVENQIQTNEKIVANLDKKNEHLDFQKNGSSLKSSDGKIIKPREVEALKNAEFAISETAENKMDYSKALGSLLDGAELGVNSEQSGDDENNNLIKELFALFIEYDNNKIDFPEQFKEQTNG